MPSAACELDIKRRRRRCGARGWVEEKGEKPNTECDVFVTGLKQASIFSSDEKGDLGKRFSRKVPV